MHSNNCDKSLHNPRTQGTGGTGAAAILCACIALGLLAPSPSAQAAPQKGAAETGASTPTKKKGSIKVKHQRSPSEESTAERDRRLYRECKELPNAGACLGYTRR